MKKALIFLKIMAKLEREEDRGQIKTFRRQQTGGTYSSLPFSVLRSARAAANPWKCPVKRRSDEKSASRSCWEEGAGGGRTRQVLDESLERLLLELRLEVSEDLLILVVCGPEGSRDGEEAKVFLSDERRVNACLSLEVGRLDEDLCSPAESLRTDRLETGTLGGRDDLLELLSGVSDVALASLAEDFSEVRAPIG